MMGLPLNVGPSASATACIRWSGLIIEELGSGDDTLLSSFILSSHGFPPIPPRGAFGGPPTLLFGHGLPLGAA